MTQPAGLSTTQTVYDMWKNPVYAKNSQERQLLDKNCTTTPRSETIFSDTPLENCIVEEKIMKQSNHLVPLRLSLGLASVLVLLCAGTQSCVSTAADPEQSIEAIEDAKEPLQDNDCLEGEYFDKGTESCEPLETETAPENSHDGPIDVPK